MTAFRARQALDRKAAGGAPTQADLDRPVTMAPPPKGLAGPLLCGQ